MQNYPQMQTPMQTYTVPPKIVYNNQGNVPAANQTTQNLPQTTPSVPMAHIPLEQDVLSLSTKPDSNISLNTTQNKAASPVNAELNAQMPAPDLKNNNQNLPQTEENNVKETPLPSLNIGVVDAPNNGSKTPVIDDINARAQELEAMDNINPSNPTLNNQNNSPVPQTLGKKPLSAGKLSAYLSLGSLGLILAMIVPKGISKIIKLIKHK